MEAHTAIRVTRRQILLETGVLMNPLIGVNCVMIKKRSEDKRRIRVIKVRVGGGMR